MKRNLKSGLAFLLRCAAYPVGVLGGLCFWFGDRFLTTFAHFDIVTAEIVSITVAVALLLFSFTAKSLAENLEIDDVNGISSFAEALRTSPTNSVQTEDTSKTKPAAPRPGTAD